MTEINVNDFEKEVTCVYRGEKYSVRDNGAVLRHSRTEKRLRKDDNQWTFGKPNNQNGYMQIGQARIHRIVATAFHGEPPTPEHIVDHIDTNRQNNRPENLRWLTRLENALLNPITRNRIEYICGSIEKFAKNPSILHEHNLPPNLEWMRNVTPEEAKNCTARLSVLARTKTKVTQGRRMTENRYGFSKNIYKPFQRREIVGKWGRFHYMSETRWCTQYMLRWKNHFPCCPNEFGENPIDDYFKNIKDGDIFAHCDDEPAYKMIVFEKRIIDTEESFIVMGQVENNNWLNVLVTLSNKNHFTHLLIDVYEEKDNAYKAFLSQKKGFNPYSKTYNEQIRELREMNALPKITSES